jgi:putative endopeptidase
MTLSPNRLAFIMGEPISAKRRRKTSSPWFKTSSRCTRRESAKKTFLAKKTREKAILKLDKMVIKMGYPDKVEEVYDTLTVDPTSSLYEALSILEKENNLYSFKELNKEVDRSRWTMPGDMVNACYESATNDITFPAAILQAPFYSLKQSRSANLGGIGTVIGHEISHAFDNNGALFDENGNIKQLVEQRRPKTV